MAAETSGESALSGETTLALETQPLSMNDAATEARRLTLIRFERAAGATFGYDDETVSRSSSRVWKAQTSKALATLASAVAATITSLV